MTKKILIPIFVLVQLALYIVILFFKTDITNILCFLTVLLCFLFSFVLFSLKGRTYLSHFALLFTVVSDIFLCLCQPQQKTIAMISFSFVQIFYFARILTESENKTLNLVHGITRASLSVIILIVTAVVLKNKTDFLSMISMFYYTNLILNVIFAWFNKNSSLLLKIGLILFLCCDTFVGLQSIGAYLPFNESSPLYQIIFSPFNFVWFFYVPSQVCLCLSIASKKKLKVKN